MQVLEFDIPGYCAAEQDLCEQHRTPEDDRNYERELRQIRKEFAELYPELPEKRGFEFPYEHFHLRLFWSYLHNDVFYANDFVPRVQGLLARLPRSWFAEFECYSPSLESPELPSGYFGQFLIFKDTVMFCKSDTSADLRAKLGV